MGSMSILGFSSHVCEETHYSYRGICTPPQYVSFRWYSAMYRGPWVIGPAWGQLPPNHP
jgi:hypothetical protein